MRWRVAHPVVESVKIDNDERQQNQVMKFAYSWYSGEDDVVGVTSVDGEGSQTMSNRV